MTVSKTVAKPSGASMIVGTSPLSTTEAMASESIPRSVSGPDSCEKRSLNSRYVIRVPS